MSMKFECAFGIKAKLRTGASFYRLDFAAPVFGIKAKHDL